MSDQTAIELIRTIDHAMTLLDNIYSSPGASVVWLTSNQRLLDGRIPLEMLRAGESPGVIDCLTSIIDGVYV